jgi:hypothetical protein
MPPTTLTTTLPPLRFATPDELEDLWLQYKTIARDQNETVNLAGLLIVLGLTRSQFQLLAKHPLYEAKCRKFTQIIENAWVQRLMGTGAQGAMFYLKNQFKDDYKDHYDVETTHLFPSPILGSLGQEEATKTKIIDVTPEPEKNEVSERTSL